MTHTESRELHALGVSKVLKTIHPDDMGMFVAGVFRMGAMAAGKEPDKPIDELDVPKHVYELSRAFDRIGD